MKCCPTKFLCSVVPPVADGRQVGRGMWKAEERDLTVTKVPLSSLFYTQHKRPTSIKKDQMVPLLYGLGRLESKCGFKLTKAVSM